MYNWFHHHPTITHGLLGLISTLAVSALLFWAGCKEWKKQQKFSRKAALLDKLKSNIDKFHANHNNKDELKKIKEELKWIIVDYELLFPKKTIDILNNYKKYIETLIENGNLLKTALYKAIEVPEGSSNIKAIEALDNIVEYLAQEVKGLYTKLYKKHFK